MKRTLILLLSLMLLTIMACDPLPPPLRAVQPDAPQRVLVAGDSMAADVSDDLARLLNREGDITTVETHPGSGLRRGHPDYTYDWVPRLRKLRDMTTPDVVVLFLGTNDAWWTPLPELANYQQAIDDVLQVFPGTPVWWVLPNLCGQDTTETFRGVGQRVVSDIWRATMEHAIDTHAAACPNRIPDHVHLTVQGQRDVAAVVDRALSAARG